MIWRYQLTTHTIWASFDYGQVEADTEAEALVKAKAQLEYDLKKCNEILAQSDVTSRFEISMDFSQIEVEIERSK